MGTLGRKAVACLCTLVLAMGMVPLAAYGEGGLDAAVIDGAALAERAAAIDAQAEGFEDGGMIVVYRENAAEQRTVERGIATQSVEVAKGETATAEVISEDAGIEGGGAALRVDLPAGVSVGEAVAAAEADPDVVHAQPIFQYYLLDSTTNDPVVDVTTNDGETPNQWWLHSVNAPEAWKTAKGEDAKPKVSVAIMDTGVNFTHEDLAANILEDYAYDSYNLTKMSDSPTSEQMAHGSHVAGIVSGVANNGKGIAGVSYNANILPIRVFHLQYSASYGYEVPVCSDEDLIAAYDYLLSDDDNNGETVAQETNTRVVNMSLGGYLSDAVDQGEDPMEAYDLAFEKKIHQAQEAGILTVAAAGNGDGYGNPRYDASYPSDYPDVMSVIALQSDTERTSWSDANESKNISAPGNEIYSTWWTGNEYHFDSGTSMASPLVAGCAALLWSYDPQLSVQDVKDAIYDTAVDLGATGFDSYYGWGRIDVAAAIESIGTASVGAEKTTMRRATRQKLTVRDIKNPAANHDWKWSVSERQVDGEGNVTDVETTKATITDDGTLTARETGKVVVTVQDENDAAYIGHRTIEIAEIEIPGGAKASANPSVSTITVRWAAAEGAAKYRVKRATASADSATEPGDFSDLARFSIAEGETIDEGNMKAAENDGSIVFTDKTAKASELYWYEVTPLGSLDGVDVEGEAAKTARCFYSDKKQLKADILAARGALANTKSSTNSGKTLTELQYWTTPAARSALNAKLSAATGVYSSSKKIQAEVDAAAKNLETATAAFNKARKKGAKAAAANTMTAKAVASKVEVAKGKKTMLAAAKTLTVSKAQGAVTYKKASGNAAITVASNGTMTVPSTLKAGNYPVKVAVTAAGNGVSIKPKTVTVSFTVKVGATNPMTVTAKAAQIAAGKSLAASKVFTVKKAQGAVTYAKASGNAAITVAKNGAISVKKGTKKTACTIYVNVTAAGNGSYNSLTKKVAVKVTVK